MKRKKETKYPKENVCVKNVKYPSPINQLINLSNRQPN